MNDWRYLEEEARYWWKSNKQTEKQMQFTKATRKQASSAGTYGAERKRENVLRALMASGIGGKIAVVDTERSSASLYSASRRVRRAGPRSTVHAGTLHRGRAGR